MVGQFNPEMLVLARESRGLTQSDLAALMSVKQGTISKLESGMLALSPALSEVVCAVTKYAPSFFYQSDRVYGFNSTVFFHRKRQSLADRVLRKLHAQMNLTRMRVSRLLRSVQLETPSRFQPMEPGEYEGGIVATARLVRSTWLLPSGPVRNVTRAIEDAGGIVVKMDFETRQADAISEWVPGSTPIFLVNSNSDIPGDRYRLTLAHEIAHVILHRFPNPKMEDEANSFAAEFLLPRREIKSSLLGLNMMKLAELKRYWKVSMAAIVQRAYELKTITESQRRYLFINISKKTGSRIHEPLEDEMPVEQPTLFNRLIQCHIRDMGYSSQELAQTLFYADEDEFRAQCFGEKRLRLV